MIVPSYIAKVARAKKHLIDLQAAIDLFAAGHPYTVRERIEGKKKRKVRRLAFTTDPTNTDIPIIAADAIYNLRSSLEHLMFCLVPSNQGHSTTFPIYFEGVWEPALPGENKERCKERARWASDTKALPEPALAILKNLQPADSSWKEQDGVDLLEWLNRLSNCDRHRKLPVIARGLGGNLRVRFTLPDGTREDKPGTGSAATFEDGADIEGIPNDAVDVEIEGSPVIAIRVGEFDGYLRIPETLLDIASFIEDSVIGPLIPFAKQ